MVDFIGSDEDSQNDKCPAVFRDPLTGDFYQQGRLVKDPALLKRFGQDISLAEDEAVVWQPANLGPSLLEAATDDYEPGRTGPGVPSFAELLAATKRSAVHLEMRETYGPHDPEFLAWKRGEPVGPGSAAGGKGWDSWNDWIGDAVKRGVTVRRVRVVSEPLSDYVAFEHAVAYANIDAGEDVRWLSRRQAYDLLLPGADLWMFDQRLVRYNFNAGDGTDLGEVYEFVSDPRKVAQVVAAVEMLWERAIPHANYHPE